MAVISLFNVTPKEVRESPGLDSALRAAGIGHLRQAVFVSPTHDSYEEWEKEYEGRIGAEIDWCVREGWDFVGEGDDLMRSEANCVSMKRWDGRAVRHAAMRAGLSKRCVGVEMVDEIQQDTFAYPLHQLGLWWYGSLGPPLAFPGHAPQRFETWGWTDSFLAHYISRQWNWWTCQKGSDRLARLRGSLSDVPRDGRPIAAMLDVSGLYGQVDSRGRVVTFGRKPPSALNITKQFALAREMGATRFNLWAGRCKRWEEEWANAKEGDEVFKGIAPGTPEWEAMAKAIALLKPRS